MKEFHINDVVAYEKVNSLFRIIKIYGDEAVLEHTKTGVIYRRQPLSKFRHATKAERLAERRIDSPTIETKATKYDWSNVPDWVQWLATDCLGVGGFAVKPSYSSFLQGWTSYGQGGSACLVLTAPDCAFENSLEQRPAQGGDL